MVKYLILIFLLLTFCLLRGDAHDNHISVPTPPNYDRSKVISICRPRKHNFYTQKATINNFLIKNFSSGTPGTRGTPSTPGIKINSPFNSISSSIKTSHLESDGFMYKKTNDKFLITFHKTQFIDLIYFKDLISKYTNDITSNTDFFVLVKVRYSGNIYKMAGTQMHFSYNGNKDFDNKIQFLYDSIIMRVNILFEEYSFGETNLDSVQIIFNRYNKVLLSDVKLDENISYNELPLYIKKDLFYIPISTEKLGIKLNSYKENNNLFVTISDNIIWPSDRTIRINGDKNSFIFNSDTQFYLRNISKPNYIMAYLYIDNGDSCIKACFDLLGNLICQVTDVKNTEGNIFRYSKDAIIKLESNGTMVYYEKDLKIKHITFIKKKTSSYLEDQKIGVMDLEVYDHSVDNISYVYSAGMHTSIDKSPKLFYLDPITKDSDKLILDLIDQMGKLRYRNFKFYCHNFGKYDVYFILKVLTKFNSKNKDVEYKIDTNMRDNVILTIKIKKVVKGKTIFVVTIADSYPILTKSLAQLGKDFAVDQIKTLFPYKFANENTLFYSGNIPDISFYDNISNQEYIDLGFVDRAHIRGPKPKWDFKKESDKYLTNDLVSLLQVIEKANQELYLNFEISITDANTISGLAKRIFMIKHYSDNIPLINDNKIYQDIKNSYYGGITEVYKPKGNNLYYYDVNSLYPYVALFDMPGTKASYVKFTKHNEYNLHDLFGFFKCEVYRDPQCQDYIGLLPVRTKQGSLIHPLGSWTGWYFSEEIKFAVNNGYKVRVIEGYKFNKQSDVFKSFVENIYKIKSTTSNQALKSMSKLILNSLLGRFGLKLDKTITEYVTDELKYQKIAATRPILSEVSIDDTHKFVTYKKELDLDLIKSLNLDINKLNQKYTDLDVLDKDNDPKDVSVAISSAITSYARIHISKIKLDIIKNGGSIYYSDTDSIVTDNPLSNFYVDNNKIGKLKLEYDKVKTGYFISNKTYCLVLEDGRIVKRSKGINSQSLTLQNYIDMYENGEIFKEGYRIESIKNYNEGFVKLFERKNININPASYTKRSRIFDYKGLWVDTKPLIIDNGDIKSNYNNTGKSLIKWVNNYNLIIYKPSITSLILNKTYNFKASILITDFYNLVYYKKVNINTNPNIITSNSSHIDYHKKFYNTYNNLSLSWFRFTIEKLKSTLLLNGYRWICNISVLITYYLVAWNLIYICPISLSSMNVSLSLYNVWSFDDSWDLTWLFYNYEIEEIEGTSSSLENRDFNFFRTIIDEDKTIVYLPVYPNQNIDTETLINDLTTKFKNLINNKWEDFLKIMEIIFKRPLNVERSVFNVDITVPVDMDNSSISPKKIPSSHWLSLVDFNKYIYYPSKFIPYNLPIIFNSSDITLQELLKHLIDSDKFNDNDLIKLFIFIENNPYIFNQDINISDFDSSSWSNNSTRGSDIDSIKSEEPTPGGLHYFLNRFNPLIEELNNLAEYNFKSDTSFEDKHSKTPTKTPTVLVDDTQKSSDDFPLSAPKKDENGVNTASSSPTLEDLFPVMPTRVVGTTVTNFIGPEVKSELSTNTASSSPTIEDLFPGMEARVFGNHANSFKSVADLTDKPKNVKDVNTPELVKPNVLVNINDNDQLTSNNSGISSNNSDISSNNSQENNSYSLFDIIKPWFKKLGLVSDNSENLSDSNPSPKVDTENMTGTVINDNANFTTETEGNISVSEPRNSGKHEACFQLPSQSIDLSSAAYHTAHPNTYYVNTDVEVGGITRTEDSTVRESEKELIRLISSILDEHGSTQIDLIDCIVCSNHCPGYNKYEDVATSPFTEFGIEKLVEKLQSKLNILEEESINLNSNIYNLESTIKDNNVKIEKLALQKDSLIKELAQLEEENLKLEGNFLDGIEIKTPLVSSPSSDTSIKLPLSPSIDTSIKLALSPSSDTSIKLEDNINTYSPGTDTSNLGEDVILNNIKKELDNRQLLIDELNDDNYKINIELDSFKQKVAEDARIIDKLNKSIDKLNNHINSVESDILNVNNKFKPLEKNYNKLVTDLKEKDLEIKENNIIINSLNDEIIELNMLNRKLSKKVED